MISKLPKDTPRNLHSLDSLDIFALDKAEDEGLFVSGMTPTVTHKAAPRLQVVAAADENAVRQINGSEDIGTGSFRDALSYVRIRVECPYPIQYITDLEIESLLGDHCRVSVKGVLRNEDGEGCIQAATCHDPIRIYDTDGAGDGTLFSGIVTMLKVYRASEVYEVEIEGMSYT